MSFLDNPYKWTDKREFILSPEGLQFVKNQLQDIISTTYDTISETFSDIKSPIADINKFQLVLDNTNGWVRGISDLWLFRHKDHPDLFSVRGAFAFYFSTEPGSTNQSASEDLYTFCSEILRQLKSLITVDDRNMYVGEVLGSHTGTFVACISSGVDLALNSCHIRVPFQIELPNQDGKYVIPTPPKKRGRPPKNKLP